MEKEKIINFLKLNKISAHEIVENTKYGYIVNIQEDVNLSNLKIEFLPFKFGIIKGNFSCDRNKLKNLENFPNIVTGNFSVFSNEIESLEYFPQLIEGNINISGNRIRVLENIQKEVNGNFVCSNNKLKDLKGCPEIVKGNFYCTENEIESLKYFPKIVNKNISVRKNFIKKLENIQNKVDGNFDCSSNLLEDLEGVPKIIRESFNFHDNPLKELKDFHINSSFFIDDNILSLLTEKHIKKIEEKYFKNELLLLNSKIGNKEYLNEELIEYLRAMNLNKKVEKMIKIKKERISKI